jgi:hypothetical protein
MPCAVVLWLVRVPCLSTWGPGARLPTGDRAPAHEQQRTQVPQPRAWPHTHDTANDTTAQLLCGPRALARLSRTLTTSRPLPL